MGWGRFPFCALLPGLLFCGTLRAAAVAPEPPAPPDANGIRAETVDLPEPTRAEKASPPRAGETEPDKPVAPPDNTSSDPVLNLAERANARPDPDAKADVVDLDSDFDPRRASQGPWATPDEERGPRSVTRGRGAPRAGDPEWPRILPAEAEDAIPVAVPAAQDYEVRRAGNAGADAPRFPAGIGLDKDEAELAARLKPVEPKPPVPPVQEPPPPPSPPTYPRPSFDAPEPAGEADKDLQTALAQAREANRMLQERREAENNRPGPQDANAAGPGLRIRDPHAANAVNALREPEMGAVICRVTDPETRLPVPVRVRITDATDVAAQAPLPEGSWCDGGLTARTVAGPVKVEVSRGRFWPAALHGVEVKPGMASIVNVPMGRHKAMDFTLNGWYLADLELGVRLQAGEQQVWFGEPPSLGDLVLAARAEGVQIVGVPVPGGPGEQTFTLGDLARVQTRDLLLMPVFPGPRHPFNGSAYSLGLSSFGNLPAELNSPEVPLRDTFDDIRSRGGLVVFSQLAGLKRADLKKDIYPLFPRLQEHNWFPAQAPALCLYGAHELPFDTVTGPAYDAFAFDGSPLAENFWFNLLNQGYMISAVGAAGGSLEGGRVPFGQTFIKLPGRPSEASVLEALRNGRTSISFGPAVFCRILERDMGPGAVLPADGRPLTLQVQACASNTKAMQIEQIELLRNGEVVLTHKPSEGETLIQDLRWALAEKSTAWYIVRVSERTQGREKRQGWTAPFYFRTPSFSAPEPVRTRLSGTLSRNGVPVKGALTVLMPGQPGQSVETTGAGRFKAEIPACATLVFEAPGCEPRVMRLFEHPAIRRALGGLQTEQSAPVMQQLAKPSVLGYWRLLLSELEWNVDLTPLGGRFGR